MRVRVYHEGERVSVGTMRVRVIVKTRVNINIASVKETMSTQLWVLNDDTHHGKTSCV